MLMRVLRWYGLFAMTACSGALLSVAASPGQLAANLEDTARHPQSTVDAQGVESVAITVVGTLAWLTLAWLVLAILLVAASNAPAGSVHWPQWPVQSLFPRRHSDSSQPRSA